MRSVQVPFLSHYSPLLVPHSISFNFTQFLVKIGQNNGLVVKLWGCPSPSLRNAGCATGHDITLPVFFWTMFADFKRNWMWNYIKTTFEWRTLEYRVCISSIVTKVGMLLRIGGRNHPWVFHNLTPKFSKYELIVAFLQHISYIPPETIFVLIPTLAFLCSNFSCICFVLVPSGWTRCQQQCIKKKMKKQQMNLTSLPKL